MRISALHEVPIWDPTPSTELVPAQQVDLPWRDALRAQYVDRTQEHVHARCDA